jgi:hypothetical protein
MLKNIDVSDKNSAAILDTKYIDLKINDLL